MFKKILVKTGVGEYGPSSLNNADVAFKLIADLHVLGYCLIKLITSHSKNPSSVPFS